MDILIIFVTPVALVLFGFVIIRFRRLDWRGDVGFQLPSAPQAVIWLLAFLALAVASEMAGGALGVESNAGSWHGKYDALNLAIRIAAIGLIYPLAEEFFFRGALLGMASRKLGAAGGVLISALAFAAVHLQYDWRSMALIFVDALFYAICRTRTGSIYLVMAMHMLGNGYAIWERLSP